MDVQVKKVLQHEASTTNLEIRELQKQLGRREQEIQEGKIREDGAGAQVRTLVLSCVSDRANRHVPLSMLRRRVDISDPFDSDELLSDSGTCLQLQALQEVSSTLQSKLDYTQQQAEELRDEIKASELEVAKLRESLAVECENNKELSFELGQLKLSISSQVRLRVHVCVLPKCVRQHSFLISNDVLLRLPFRCKPQEMQPTTGSCATRAFRVTCCRHSSIWQACVV